MHKLQHPDPETLDRLRAGLLDDHPTEKTAVEQHLAACEQCRTSAATWTQLDPNALGPQFDDNAIGTALRSARQHALASAGNRAPAARRLLPYAAAATVALAVTIGLWTSQPGIDTNNRVATNEVVPDVYEDLDFYLWLAGQGENGTDNGNT